MILTGINPNILSNTIVCCRLNELWLSLPKYKKFSPVKSKTFQLTFSSLLFTASKKNIVRNKIFLDPTKGVWYNFP